MLPYEICACRHCLNCRYKADTLLSHGLKSLSRKHIPNLMHTYCVPDDPIGPDEKRSIFSYKIDCIQRTCDDCGVHLLRDLILNHEENKNVDFDKKATYRVYEDVRAGDPGKKSKTTRNMVTCSLREILERYLKDLHDISCHIFTWVWQGSQFEEYKKNLHDGEVLMCADFSQNWPFRAKEEIQVKYFDLLGSRSQSARNIFYNGYN